MALMERGVVFFVFLGFCAITVLSQSNQKLLQDLQTDYDRVSPPPGTSVVKFEVVVNQLQDVNEADHTITLRSWLRLSYWDLRLRWDPAKYDDIQNTRIPYKDLWIPDIVLYNGVSGSEMFADNMLAKVYSNGYVWVIPPGTLTAACVMDLTYFPYDIQTCKLKFGSWSYDDSIIVLQPNRDDADLQYYEPHPEWELLNATMKQNAQSYPCCPNETYHDVTLTVDFKRKAGPYSMMHIVPSVLTAFLIIFTFILPSSSGEKMVFGMIILLSLILLNVHLHIEIPSNTESVLGEFLTFALFLVFFAIVIAVICYSVADTLLMRDKLGGPESEKHWASRKRKLKHLRIAEFVFFFLFLIIFIIGTAVILCRRDYLDD